MPVDTGKVFVRIPEFWSADVLYTVAEKLGPIDKCSFVESTTLFPFCLNICIACFTAMLKFDLSELNNSSINLDYNYLLGNNCPVFGIKRSIPLLR